MHRTSVGFPDKDLRVLDAISARLKLPRNELIRLAVSSYIEKFRSDNDADTQAFGVWKLKKLDGMAYQTEMRKLW